MLRSASQISFVAASSLGGGRWFESNRAYQELILTQRLGATVGAEPEKRTRTASGCVPIAYVSLLVGAVQALVGGLRVMLSSATGHTRPESRHRLPRRRPNAGSATTSTNG
jgi:hypothetical protein